jgi:hypothetical protein
MALRTLDAAKWGESTQSHNHNIPGGTFFTSSLVASALTSKKRLV